MAMKTDMCMKIFLFLSLLFTIVFARVQGCDYDAKLAQVALLDDGLVKILNIDTQKIIKNIHSKDKITCLAYDKSALYVGLSSGEVIKFDPVLGQRSVFSLADTKSWGEISLMKILNDKIYALIGQNTLIVYDMSSKKLIKKDFPQIYRISALLALDSELVMAGYDGAVYSLKPQNLEATRLLDLGFVPTSACILKGSQDVIFGLFDGEVVSLKSGLRAKVAETKICALACLDSEIYAGGGDGKIYKLDRNLKILSAQKVHTDELRGIFTDKDFILSVAFDGDMKYKKAD